ncbi:hypothetical protein B0T14DRAFT_540554 [Immersiella caudata]|uniref:Uncharacterized protein n=1 Tax=Immersiella caudata TaxID=314043 RepID=A0AA39U5G5_9PEZI|nr:hypothetical protein B0T14DRAFT_540554 [Immersiella caudata]
MASASTNNSITVASITVSRDVSDASSRPSSPTSPNQHPAEDHDMDLGDVNGVAPDTSSGPLVILESLPVAPSSVLLPPARTGYEKANLDEITARQLNEDTKAYHFDLNFCRAQLDQDDLTPQESRTFQLRILDLTHQIRHCQHRIESLRVTMRGKPLRGAYGVTTSSAANPLASTSHAIGKPASKRTNTGISTPGGPTNNKRPFEPDTNDTEEPKTNGATPIITKRPKIQLAVSPADHDHDTSVVPEGEGDNTTLQRLGYWRCRLCEAPKYLLAPAGRSPAMPCKWPLKDISKMITHFTEMHAEHSPTERCKELSQALAKNRGPFEYWLRRTRAQNVGDGSVMDEVIHTLDDGKMPTLLRKLSRAAAGMPSS